MATVTVTTVRNVEVLRGPITPYGADYTSSTNTAIVKNAVVWIDTGSQAAASGDTISIALSALIASSLRNGKTINCRTATLMQPAFNLTDGVAMCAKTIALTAGTTGTLTFIPTTNDWSTGVAIDATDKIERPWSFLVTFTEQ